MHALLVLGGMVIEGGYQVSTVDELDEVIERCQRAPREFVRGNPEPMQEMFSHREDVTLANPIAPPRVGGSGSLPPWRTPRRT